MYKTIVFIDFENLQKLTTDLITPDTKIIVLVGSNQKKTALDFAKEQFNKSYAIEFIMPNVKGKNALDFCIVFYVGLNIAKYMNSHIVIYSKDGDYDPLIEHLSEIGISIERKEYIESEKSQIVERKKTDVSPNKNIDINQKYKEVINHFERKQTKARPRKIKTLETYLQKTLFNKKISDENIQKIIELMQKDKVVEISNKINGAIKFNKVKM